MAERITRRQVQGVFGTLLQVMGKRPATAWNDVGGWRLDYGLGGYCVDEIMNASGGLRRPLGHTRMKASEFYYACHFAINAIGESERHGWS